jgi:hypothetical protein
VARARRRYGCEKFLAYFQPATNTYAPVDRLRGVFLQAFRHPQVVGLVIGTRPDCLPDDVLQLLEELAARTYVSVEVGMQTMHDRTLDWMNRGHRHAAFRDAMQRGRGRGFDIGAHVILGLPGETAAEMLQTAEELAHTGIDSVKVHNLYAVRNTRLAEELADGKIRLMDRQEYVDVLVSFLERLPSRVVVERLSGDAPRQYFLAPDWCLDKPGVRTAVEEEFRRRGSWQGKHDASKPGAGPGPAFGCFAGDPCG